MGFSFLHEVQNPGKGFIENGGFEGVGDELAPFAGGDEAGAPQEIEMIGDARGAHGKGVGDLARGEVAVAEHFEDVPAGVVLKGFELQVHGEGTIRYLDMYLNMSRIAPPVSRGP